MPLPSGTRLGPYEIVAHIGSGGMGDVYRARDIRLDRDVAVKVLPDRLVHDENSLARFEREAKSVAALSHPNILAIHDYGSAERMAYSVTELLEGDTLRQRIARGPIGWRKVLDIGAAIADGLAAAHAKGIIHRDLKPENIFLTTDGRVKILDFGVAQLLPQPGETNADLSDTPTAPLLTNPGAIVGTAGYMAPEQLRGQASTPASDTFSLGCILYEMVTGKAAFLRRSVVESLSAILTDQIDVFGDSAGTVPFELARVIERCLEKNPAERFQSARDLAFALRAIGTSTSLQFTAPRRPVRPAVWMAGALIVAAAIGGHVFYRRGPAPVRSEARHSLHSVAVLPFVNATRDREAEYLSDGLTETLINTLSRLPGLKVMSRTSVFHYKGSPPDLQRVARELGVGAVLVGRISDAGERLLVSVELVNVNDGTQLWGSRYTAEGSDLFAVQQSITTEISRNLRLTLSPQTQQRLARQQTTSPAAYDLYLKGRFQWNKRSAEGLYKAIDYFNQAIETDPRYALAYAGLADCYNLLDIWANLPTKETFPKARAAAEKALELDEELAEAHTSLAYAIHSYEWQWDAAERAYRRALELNPNYATAHQWYAEFLTSRGRFEEAEREGRRALELDPMSPIINAVVGWNYTMARRHDAAIEQNLRTTQLFPSFMAGHAYLGLAYLESGRGREAIASLARARQLLDIPVIRTWLIRARLAAGERDAAEAALRELLTSAGSTYLPPYYMGTVYAALGQPDRAFEYLEKALAERTGAMVWFRVDPALDPIRKDARYGRMLERL